MIARYRSWPVHAGGAKEDSGGGGGGERLLCAAVRWMEGGAGKCSACIRPAVSQICALMTFPSVWMLLVANSTPIVDLLYSHTHMAHTTAHSSRGQRDRRGGRAC